MSSFDRLTPREAVEEMILAGARFSVTNRTDGLGLSFTYSLEPGANKGRCRALLAAAKDRPAQYFAAFRSEVQRVAGQRAAQ